MTHELRTPLTGVVGMTNLLQATPLDAEQREYADSIVSSAEVLQALIGDVLDLSKIEAKQLHLESVAFDLRGSMKEICAALETQALAKRLEVILRIDPGLPDRMIGDKLRVRQILFDLIGNAIKFTARGEVMVRASWGPSDELMHRPHLLLEVLDTGIRIPADRLEEIFEGFRQADDSTTRRYGGTGLGATIARNLTHLMRGRIGVDSQVGKGSRFWVRLPLRQEPGPLASQEQQRRLVGRRALVFEHNATSRELIMETLRGAGMVCEPVLDIDHLGHMTDRIRRLDLLIVADSPDRQDLPTVLDLFRRVLSAEVPYLLLTYSTRRPDRRIARGNCLSKPFLAEDLVGQVRRILGKERPQSDSQEETKAERKDTRQPVTMHGLRILVAEDNAIAGKVVRVLLEKQGYEVILVDDGEQALSCIRAEPFALALVDVRMPKLDGIALTRAFRSSEGHGARLPIVALTANASEEVKHQCLEAGMDDFLSKPVNPRDLSTMVERYTGQREGDGSSHS